MITNGKSIQKIAPPTKFDGDRNKNLGGVEQAWSNYTIQSQLQLQLQLLSHNSKSITITIAITHPDFQFQLQLQLLFQVNH